MTMNKLELHRLFAEILQDTIDEKKIKHTATIREDGTLILRGPRNPLIDEQNEFYKVSIPGDGKIPPGSWLVRALSIKHEKESDQRSRWCYETFQELIPDGVVYTAEQKAKLAEVLAYAEAEDDDDDIPF